MATTYTRRINLYINGKQVEDNIVSIRNAMQKLVNEQARMTRGSAEYQAHAAKIRQLRGILAEHRNDLNQTSKSWISLSSVAEKFNKYQGLLLGFIGSFAGVALTVKSAVRSYAEFEDKLADVMKTTGLSREQVGALNEELKKIDTRSSQEELLNLSRIAGKLGITDAQEILGFVRATDQIGVALKEDLGGNVEDAVRELGKLVDIFKLKDEFGMEQSLLKVGSAINELGMASTANEKYLVEFSKRTAGIAPIAGVSIQNILGLAATLDSLGQTSEVSSTAYSKLMTTMSKKTAEFAAIAKMDIGEFSRLLGEDANEAMIRVFEGLKGNSAGLEALVASLGDIGLEGQRMTSVFGALANNTETLRKQQHLANEAFEEGTSLTDEFNIKNNTAQANLEKARKKFFELTLVLGQKLTPAYTSVISKARLMLDVITVMVDFFTKYGGAIMGVVTSLIAYTAAVKILALWESRKNKEIGIGLLLSKTQIFLANAQKAAIIALAGAKALLTGNLHKAATAMRIFNTITRLNPIGLVASAVAIAITAFTLWSKKTRELTAAQKQWMDVETRANDSLAERKVKMEQLLAIARDERRTMEDRSLALRELQSISQGHLQNLTLENINTKAADTSIKEYTESLIKNARVMAARELLIELEKERMNELTTGADKAVSGWTRFWARMATSGGDLDLYNRIINEKSEENAKKSLDSYSERVKALMSIINDNQTGNPFIGLSDSDGDVTETTKDLIQVQKYLLEQAKKMPGTTEAEIIARNRKVESIEKEIQRLSALGVQNKQAEKQQKDLIKEKLDALTAADREETNLIHRRHLEGKTSEAQYKADLLAQEIKFLQQKRDLYEKDSPQYQEADLKITQTLLKAQKEVDDLLLQAKSGFEDARIKSIEDAFEKEKALEEKRFQEEIAALQKQLILKEQLSDKEVEINQTTQKTIEELTLAHQQKMTEIDRSSSNAKLMEQALIRQLTSVTDAQEWQARKDIAQLRHQEELQNAKGNALLIAQANRELNDELKRIELERLSVMQEIEGAKLELAISGLGALAQLAGEETKLGKALFLMQQAAAVGQIIFQTGIANAKAVAASPMTFGQPWVAINTASAAVSIASILAQTISKFVTPKVAEPTGFSTGGYTGDGPANQPAGVVHKGEWVAPQSMVRDPLFGPVIHSLEMMRQKKTSLNSQMLPAVAHKGYQSGGYVTASSDNTSNPVLIQQIKQLTSLVENASSMIREQKEVISRNNEVMEKIRKWDPSVKVYTELIRKDLDTLEQIERNRGM